MKIQIIFDCLKTIQYDHSIFHESGDFQIITYEQSAVIPYRFKDEKPEILAITNISGKRWIFPKGLVEPELTPAESAAMEAMEEAGIKGEIHPEPVGNYQYEKWGGVCKVEVYLMKVTEIHDEWQEMKRRKRKWMSPKKIMKKIDKRIHREMLDKAMEKIIF